MPKNKKEVTKEKVNVVLKKNVENDEEEEKVIDPDGILGEDALEEDEELLDDEEVDPFGDKWEQ